MDWWTGLLAGLGTLLGVTAPPPEAPPSAAVVDYQLGGAYQPADDVDVVIRDRTAQPDPARYSVCYVNAFQTQPDSLAWWTDEHPDLLLRDGDGDLVRDTDWPDEVLLDLRTAEQRRELVDVVDAWFSECADAGFRAVEPDNLDAYTRSGGLLTRADTAAYARDLVRRAHAHGLAIAQKNTAELLDVDLGFDFAVVEECEVYRECDRYAERFGDRVVEIEYTDNGEAAYGRACHYRGGRWSVLLRDRDVLPAGVEGHVFEHC